MRDSGPTPHRQTKCDDRSFHHGCLMNAGMPRSHEDRHPECYSRTYTFSSHAHAPCPPGELMVIQRLNYLSPMLPTSQSSLQNGSAKNIQFAPSRIESSFPHVLARLHRRAVMHKYKAHLANLKPYLPVFGEICVENGRDAGERAASKSPGLMKSVTPNTTCFSGLVRAD